MEGHLNQTLEDLFRDKRFFELRDELAKCVDDQSAELDFYRGAIANKFNQMQASAGFLEEYLETVKPTGEKLRACYELLGDNYAKSFEYARAGETFKWLLTNFGDEYQGEEKQYIEYSSKLWSAAGRLPPQTISISSDTQIQGVRTKTSHLEMPVEIDRQMINFVFDTGANVSNITSSAAGRLGLQSIESGISVGTSSDIRINAELAAAPLLKFGNVTLENVIFLVLKDEDIYFKKHDYQMNGIIGYPIIEACRQISITAGDEILIPANPVNRETEQNLCLDEMMPLMNLPYKDQPMTMIFDTGGHKTQFWNKFLKAHESEIMQKARLQETEFGGAGGTSRAQVYIMDELTMPVSGKMIELREVKIFPRAHHSMSRDFFGLIGQDLIRQFDKMTLDFVSMSIIFE